MRGSALFDLLSHRFSPTFSLLPSLSLIDIYTTASLFHKPRRKEDVEQKEERKQRPEFVNPPLSLSHTQSLYPLFFFGYIFHLPFTMFWGLVVTPGKVKPRRRKRKKKKKGERGKGKKANTCSL
jgi:hypothetical protein